MAKSPLFLSAQAELLKLGYHNYQLKSIYKEAIGRGDIEEVSTEEEARLIEKMNEYAAFARSCLKNIK